MKTSPIQVTYIDKLGSDLSIVNAARVSFEKTSTLDKDRNLKPEDAKLINYLAKHQHWSPLAHTSLQIRVKAPIFVARQLVKHQIGLVWNEVSRRYVDSEPEFYFPEFWRGKPVNAKQGSDGIIGDSDSVVAELVRASTEECLQTYNALLAQGVAPEQARMVLPLNCHTEWIWTGSLVAFARVCKLRLDPHAQSETSDVARLISPVAAEHFPVSWSALMEN
jgi:thymidylate synthase (FAD)